MHFDIGDTVVHRTHGLGTVIAIDEKNLAGVTQPYYVVEINLFKLWVPVDGADEGAIRFPTQKGQFEKLFDILRSPGEELPENQFQRKNVLRERMQTRALADHCRVIRDLRNRSRQHTLNQYDVSILLRAENNFIDEWVLSLGVPRSEAQRELEIILQPDPPETIAG